MRDKSRSRAIWLCVLAAVAIVCFLYLRSLKVQLPGRRSAIGDSRGSRHLPPLGRTVAGQSGASPDRRSPGVLWPQNTGIRVQGAFFDRPTLEICLIDATTGLRIVQGGIAFQPSISIAAALYREVGASGCVSTALDVGSYRLHLSSPGYIAAEQHVDLSPAQGHVIETLALSKAYVVRGQVRNADGQPQPDAYVMVVQGDFRQTMRTGAKGGFEFQVLSPEVDKVYAYLPLHPVAELGPISVRGARDSGLLITLPREAPAVKILVRVFDDRGYPIEGAEMRFLMSPAFHVADKRDDAAIAALPIIAGRSGADGSCTLSVPPRRDVVLQVGGAGGCESASDLMNVTKDVVKEVYLKCHPTFHVTVQDADGHEIKGARIVAETPSSAAAIFATGREGEYYALHYPFKIYAISPPASDSDPGFSQIAWIKEYREEVRLVLEGGRLDGSVTDKEGTPIRMFTVRLYRPGADSYSASFSFSTQDGLFTLKHVPPGRASMQVAAALPDTSSDFATGYFAQDVQIAVGQSVYVRAVVEPKPAAPVTSPERRRH